jgi:hypothetical protein
MHRGETAKGEQLTQRLDTKLFQYIGNMLHPDEMEVRTVTLAKSPYIADVPIGARLWRTEMERAYSGRYVWVRREGRQWVEYYCLDFNAPGAKMRVTKGPKQPILVFDPGEVEVENRVERTLRLTLERQAYLVGEIEKIAEYVSADNRFRKKALSCMRRLGEAKVVLERCKKEIRRFHELSKTLTRLDNEGK